MEEGICQVCPKNLIHKQNVLHLVNRMAINNCSNVNWPPNILVSRAISSNNYQDWLFVAMSILWWAKMWYLTLDEVLIFNYIFIHLTNGTLDHIISHTVLLANKKQVSIVKRSAGIDWKVHHLLMMCLVWIMQNKHQSTLHKRFATGKSYIIFTMHPYAFQLYHCVFYLSSTFWKSLKISASSYLWDCSDICHKQRQHQ